MVSNDRGLLLELVAAPVLQNMFATDDNSSISVFGRQTTESVKKDA